MPMRNGYGAHRISGQARPFAKLNGARFNGADLSNTDLADADLTNAGGQLARLGVVRLSDSPMIDTEFAMSNSYWHFQCPECGMGDFELGRLADDQELICEVCLEDGRGQIRLERWPAEENAPAYARLRPVLAA
jgi:hypothetical protein